MTTNSDDIIREEILRAGLRLYRKYGPQKVTMDEVANALGRSRTSLYYYYKNREEFFLAVLDLIVDDVMADIRQAVSQVDNIYEKFNAFCLAKIKTSKDWRNVFNIIYPNMNADEKNKHVKTGTILHQKLMHKEGIVVKEILSEAVNKKEIRVISSTDQDMLGFILSSAIRGLRNEIFDANAPYDIKDALRLLSEIIARWATN
jgi:AcrR family transcriptional regulator